MWARGVQEEKLKRASATKVGDVSRQPLLRSSYEEQGGGRRPHCANYRVPVIDKDDSRVPGFQDRQMAPQKRDFTSPATETHGFQGLAVHVLHAQSLNQLRMRPALRPTYFLREGVPPRGQVVNGSLHLPSHVLCRRPGAYRTSEKKRAVLRTCVVAPNTCFLLYARISAAGFQKSLVFCELKGLLRSWTTQVGVSCMSGLAATRTPPVTPSLGFFYS
jgi:hypothetical protein